MAGPSKSTSGKGKGVARRVSIANEDNTISPPNSPGAASHYAPPHRSAIGSPSRSQASYASALKSRPEPRAGQSSGAAATPADSGAAASGAASGAAAGGAAASRSSNQSGTTAAPSVALPTTVPPSAPQGAAARAATAAANAQIQAHIQAQAQAQAAQNQAQAQVQAQAQAQAQAAHVQAQVHRAATGGVHPLSMHNVHPAVHAAMQHVSGGWRPGVHPAGQAPFINAAGGYGAAAAYQAVPMMMAGQQNPPPQPPANPGNPPDEMGDPPPAPPPPAVPHTLNPHGTYYYPGVPSTEFGPMVHRYVPRHDAPGHPGVLFAGSQMQGGFMTNGTMHMQAGITAPINPVIIHQQHPNAQPMMIQNHSIPGGPQLMLPATNYPALNPAIIGTAAAPIPGMVPHHHQQVHQQAHQQQQQHIHHQVHVQPSMVAAAIAAGLPAQPPIHVEPVSGIGLTPGETIAQNVRIAQNNKAYEPQDFKPADPDPYRLYWFRELNGHWAVFPRRQIDRLDARWFRTDEGVFYAVRVSD